MANTLWNGGASVTAQVNTGTIANTWASSDTITTTLTAEDGSTTQTVTSTATGSTIETDVRDVHLADLQASTDNLFTAITWAASGTTAITATANVAGIPFYVGGSETTAGDGTFTYASTTANSGPHDWNTAANWDGGAVPTGSDDVRIAEGAYDILYGLDQNGVTLTSNLHVSRGFKGKIGDPGNGFYLRINGTTAFLNSVGGGIWLKGTWTNVYLQSGITNSNMAQLGGTITNLYINGAVNGTTTIANSQTVTNVYQVSRGSTLVIGETGTVTLLEAIAGTVETSRAITTLNNAGATVTHKKGAVTTLNNRGGTVKYNSGGTITTLNNYSGTFDLKENTETGVTVTNSTIWDGLVDERSGLDNVTWTNDPTVHGGELRTESASTPTP